MTKIEEFIRDVAEKGHVFAAGEIIMEDENGNFNGRWKYSVRKL